jgi:hypothetical protein
VNVGVIEAILRLKDEFSAGIRTAQASFAGMKATMGEVATKAGAMAVAFGALAVGSFVRLTSELNDLSLKTGIGTTELQKLKFAAEQNGTTIDKVANAIGQMARRLMGDDKSAVRSLERLNLSMADLRQMQPGAAFAAIEEAISKIPNPMEQSAIQLALFGKAGADLLPMVKSNLRETMEAAERLGIVLSEETVKGGDELGDSLDVLVAVGSAAIAQVLKPMLPMLIDLAKAMSGFGSVVQTAMHGIKLFWAGVVGTMRDAVDAFIKTAELAANSPIIGRIFGGVSESAIETARSIRAHLNVALVEIVAEAPKAEVVTRKLGDAVRPLREASGNAAKGLKELADAAVDLVERGIKRENEERRKLLMTQVEQLPHIRNLITAQRELTGAMLELPPRVTDWGAANNATTATLQQMTSAGMFNAAVTQEQIRGFLTVNDKTVTWRDNLAGLAQAMTQLSQTAGSTLVSALATVTNGINAGIEGVKSFKGGFDQLTSGGGIKSILGGFTGIVSGIGGIVGAAQAAIQIGKMLFSVFDRDKGRDLVEQFAATFEGGFDGPNGLHAQLLKLGDEGERLWIMLTQGVGRNNAEQAKAAIEAVTKALEGLKSAAGSVPAVNYPTGGVEATEGREPIDPENSFAGGSGGIRNFGAGTLAMLHGREAVVTESQMSSGMGARAVKIITQVVRMDGRVMAEAIAQEALT